MKFVIVNKILDHDISRTAKHRVNPRLVEEIEPGVNNGARLVFQTGRVIAIIETPDAIAAALSRGCDQ